MYFEDFHCLREPCLEQNKKAFRGGCSPEHSCYHQDLASFLPFILEAIINQSDPPRGGQYFPNHGVVASALVSYERQPSTTEG